jgi:hypothetical protein
MILKSVSKFYLQKDIVAQRKKTPNATEVQLIKKVIKYKLPESLTSSPRWQRAQLYDLLAMVDTYGLPHIFWLWQVMKHLSTNGKISLTWNPSSRLLVRNLVGRTVLWNAPICSTSGWWTSYKKYILYKDNGILGRVQYHVIQYEVQRRLSLHAHIIFWLHPKDLALDSSDIMNLWHMSLQYMTKSPRPSNPLEQRLFKLVVRKQIHSWSLQKKMLHQHQRVQIQVSILCERSKRS